jgi:hypothetical protein
MDVEQDWQVMVAGETLLKDVKGDRVLYEDIGTGKRSSWSTTPESDPIVEDITVLKSLHDEFRSLGYADVTPPTHSYVHKMNMLAKNGDIDAIPEGIRPMCTHEARSTISRFETVRGVPIVVQRCGAEIWDYLQGLEADLGDGDDYPLDSNKVGSFIHNETDFLCSSMHEKRSLPEDRAYILREMLNSVVKIRECIGTDLRYGVLLEMLGDLRMEIADSLKNRTVWDPRKRAKCVLRM